jgi:hypothetical protein
MPHHCSSVGDIRRGALGFTYDDFTSVWPRGLAARRSERSSARSIRDLRPSVPGSGRATW